MDIKVKKLTPDAKVPEIKTDGAAGADLYCTWADGLTYGTGIAIEIPEGHVGLLFPRSSIPSGLFMRNSVGVIDSDYRGELIVKFSAGTSYYEKYIEGDRIAQLVIMPIPSVSYIEAAELDTTNRGTGGFGSTGR